MTAKIAKIPTTPQPPATLGEAGRVFWARVLELYDLSDFHHQQLLLHCCEQLDRAAAAKLVIAKEGVTTKDRFGQLRVHPAVEVERSAMNSFRQNLRELGLDIEAPPTPRGPRRPGTRS